MVRKDVSELKQAFNKFLDQFEDGGQASSERVAKQILDGGLAKPTDNLETLRQENERLRQALEKIKKVKPDVTLYDSPHTKLRRLNGALGEAKKIARAALTGGEG